jgi:hypothetical protein
MAILLCCGHRVLKSFDKSILFFRLEVYMYNDTHTSVQAVVNFIFSSSQSVLLDLKQMIRLYTTE